MSEGGREGGRGGRESPEHPVPSTGAMMNDIYSINLGSDST